MLEVRYCKIYFIKVKKYLDKPIRNCFILCSTGIIYQSFTSLISKV